MKTDADWLATVLMVISAGHLIFPKDPDAQIVHHWLFACVGFAVVAIHWIAGVLNR